MVKTRFPFLSLDSLTLKMSVKSLKERKIRHCCPLAICSVPRVELGGAMNLYHGVLAKRGTQITAVLPKDEDLDYFKLLFWK